MTAPPQKKPRKRDWIDYLAYFAMALLAVLIVVAFIKTGLLEVVYMLSALFVMVVFSLKWRAK
ncbi:MAG: hypothetical protein WAO12_02465 [Venatoribacter sp.]